MLEPEEEKTDKYAITHVSRMREGDCGVILHYEISDPTSQRLASMGFCTGEEITVSRRHGSYLLCHTPVGALSLDMSLADLLPVMIRLKNDRESGSHEVVDCDIDFVRRLRNCDTPVPGTWVNPKKK